MTDATIGPPQIPGFRFESDLGSGGFADVYRYEQESLGRSVAIKVLHGLSGPASASFKAESLVMARLSNHPAVVSIYQVGTAADGRAYLVMQYCPPPHLGGKLGSRPFSVAETLDIGVRLAGAVESAHNLGVLHRDIKPANILFTEFRSPVLADFGIARAADHDTTVRAFSPAWAPPEQIRGAAATPAVDIYSLSATLWAMLLGRGPFDDDDGDRDNPTPLDGSVPHSLVTLLRTGLAPQPEDRPTSALQFARELQRIQATLGVAVTPVELWDGKGVREPSPTLRDETVRDEPPPPEKARQEPTRDDRTHLIALTDAEPVVKAPTTSSRRTRLLLPIAVGAALMVAAVVLLINLLPSPGPSPSPTQTQNSSSTTESTTPSSSPTVTDFSWSS